MQTIKMWVIQYIPGLYIFRMPVGIIDIIEIILLSFLVYTILVWIKNTRAWTLLKGYNQDEFHLEHADIVGKTMRYFAEKLGYGDEKDFWEVVGILHDLDFEKYPDQHCIKEQEI